MHTHIHAYIHKQMHKCNTYVSKIGYAKQLLINVIFIFLYHTKVLNIRNSISKDLKIRMY